MFSNSKILDSGDIEDSYVDYIKPENFDGGETNPFTHNKPDVFITNW